MLYLTTDVVTNHSTGEQKQYSKSIEISEEFLKDLRDNELEELKEIVNSYFNTDSLRQKNKNYVSTELYCFFLSRHCEIQEIVSKFSGASELLDIEIYLKPTKELKEKIEEEQECRNWI